MELNINQSINDYSFINDEEPGDERLQIIMHEVALEAKEWAVKVREKIKVEIENNYKLHLKEMGSSQSESKIVGNCRAQWIRKNLGYE